MRKLIISRTDYFLLPLFYYNYGKMQKNKIFQELEKDISINKLPLNSRNIKIILVKLSK
jgi:hypothetical protein